MRDRTLRRGAATPSAFQNALKRYQRPPSTAKAFSHWPATPSFPPPRITSDPLPSRPPLAPKSNSGRISSRGLRACQPEGAPEGSAAGAESGNDVQRTETVQARDKVRRRLMDTLLGCRAMVRDILDKVRL